MPRAAAAELPLPPRRVAGGSFAAVLAAYRASPRFDRLKPASQVAYRRILLLAEEALGALDVNAIRASHVQTLFLDTLSARPATQQMARAVIKTVESWACVRDRLPGPIATGTEVVRGGGGRAPWTEHQVALAARMARPDLARAITLMAHTGQRGSDVVRMRWSDLSTRPGPDGAPLPGIDVVTKKTGRRLWVPLSPELATALDTWEPRPPFFLVLAPGGMPYTRQGLSSAWYRHRRDSPALADLAGLHLHGLRATCVVRWRMTGATELEIANLIGMSPKMVQRYSRLADQDRMAVATVLRFAKPAAVPSRLSLIAD